jgi:hypothetical protein
MRWLAVAVCIAIAAPAAVGGGEPSPLEWLLGTRKSGTQVRLKPKASLRWHPEAAPIAGLSPEDGDSFARLRDPGDQVRIVVGGSHCEVTAYVRIADLSTVATRRALLHPSRSRAARPFADRSPGVHLEAGGRLENARRGSRLTAAAIRLDSLEARGHVDSAAVGFEFIPSSGYAIPEAAPWRTITPPAALRDRPGAGPIVARLVGGHPVNARELERRGGHALIAVGGDRLAAVGWIPTEQLDDGGGIVGGLIGGGGSGGQWLRLEVGAVLSDRARGVPIGVVTRATSALIRKREGHWTQIEMDTALGDVEVWASRRRMRTGDGD